MWKNNFIILMISLLMVSACAPTIHKDFLQNFTRHSKDNDGLFSNRVVSLKYNNKNNYLLVGYESGKIDIWDAKIARKIHEIKAHENRANMLAFSSDGKSFFSNSYFEQTTNIWDAATGNILHSIPNVRGPVGTTLKKNIYVVVNDEHVHFFDYKRKLLLPEIYVCDGIVTAIATDGSSGQMAIGAASGTIEVFKYFEQEGILTLKKVSSAKPYWNGDWIAGLQFSSNGNSLYSISRSGSIDEWTTKPFAKKRALRTGLNFIYSTAYSQEKELLALAGTNDNVGWGPGFVEVISLINNESSTFPTNNNLAVVEFIPQLSSLIIVQRRSAITYMLPNK